jgi:glucans biosynthesis protein
VVDRPALAQQPQTGDAGNGAKFGYQDVVRRARDLAAVGFDKNPPALPEALAKLDAEASRELRFRPEKAFLSAQGGPFRANLVHAGALARQPATINIIRDGVPSSIPYAAALFDYGKVKFERPLPVNLGFGGFRIGYPLNDPRASNDVASVMAHNAIQLLGRNQRAGTILRGLVLDSGGNEPDELPWFREFWIEQAGSTGEKLTLYALLDSPSATAAFHCVISPGIDTVMDVTLTVFARKSLSRIGIAPLSSMFLTGENDKRLNGDYRPERHNADALVIRADSGEWMFRPLRNPAQPSLTSLVESNPRGFGLIQRDRNFDHYQDLDQSYETKPNLWIEPRGNWGDGRLDVVERPSQDESQNNITAFWTPRLPIEPGQGQSWSYRITSSLNENLLHPLGRAINTFVTTSPLPSNKRVIVDFAGNNLSYFFPAPDQVKIVASASTGTLSQTTLQPNPRIDGFRAILDVALLPGQKSDIKLALQSAGRPLTETWLMPLQAD